MCYHHHHHLILNRKGCWGTTDDFATSFLHCSLFSTALWDLPNSRPVHSLILSSHLFLCLPCPLHPFTVPWKMVFGQTWFGFECIDELKNWQIRIYSKGFNCSLSKQPTGVGKWFWRETINECRKLMNDSDTLSRTHFNQATVPLLHHTGSVFIINWCSSSSKNRSSVPGQVPWFVS